MNNDQHDRGGWMVRTERDAAGVVRVVPADVTYLDVVGAAMPAPTPPVAPSDSSPRGERGAWRLWRRTDPEPGSAPDFDALDRALWFGDDLAGDADACRAAWVYLAGWIGRAYPGCHALRTPGATGLSLVAHSLPWGKDRPRPYEYVALAPDLVLLLAATAPQHRLEHTALAGTPMSRYTAYDARVAHLAYLRRVPVLLADGEALVHDEGPYVPYRAGKYRVVVSVPRGWRHIGLAHRARPHGAGWEWPATPGEEWECWLDECEVRLLADNPAGMPWPFEVRERLLFADTKAGGNDPLREHVERLCGEIERADREPARTPAVRALRAALRAVALHPIGLWHKHTNQRTRHVESLEELTTEDAEATIAPADGGGYTVTVSAELSAYQAHWRRPEWSTTVYARERATATRKALTAPRSAVLGVRGDAVHFADYAPDWADTGKVGCYRRQYDVTFPRERRVPESGGELLRLRETE